MKACTAANFWAVDYHTYLSTDSSERLLPPLLCLLTFSLFTLLYYDDNSVFDFFFLRKLSDAADPLFSHHTQDCQANTVWYHTAGSVGAQRRLCV